MTAKVPKKYKSKLKIWPSQNLPKIQKIFTQQVFLKNLASPDTSVPNVAAIIGDIPTKRIPAETPTVSANTLSLEPEPESGKKARN